MSKGWDSTALKKLKSLIGKGLSTSEIGRRLGMSKNAVVGKLNRLGWNAKAGGGPVAGTEVKPATKKVKTEKPVEKTAKKTTKKTADAVVEKVESKNTIKKTVVKADKKSKTPKEQEKTENKKIVSETGKKVSEKSLAAHQRIIQHSLEMANLKPNQCRWPIGDPDSENFHFCGEMVFVGKPYCYEHCKQAYQFAPPKKTSVK
jgi:GcrA cell cycle regulator